MAPDVGYLCLEGSVLSCPLSWLLFSEPSTTNPNIATYSEAMHHLLWPCTPPETIRGWHDPEWMTVSEDQTGGFHSLTPLPCSNVFLGRFRRVPVLFGQTHTKQLADLSLPW